MAISVTQGKIKEVKESLTWKSWKDIKEYKVDRINGDHKGVGLKLHLLNWLKILFYSPKD